MHRTGLPCLTAHAWTLPHPRTDVVTTHERKKRPESPTNTGIPALYQRDYRGNFGLAKGTVHGLLRTLRLVGYVEQDPDTSKYQLGAALLHMGSVYLNGNELRARALKWSDSLAAHTQEAVRIGTLHDRQVLIVHHVFATDDSFQTPGRKTDRCCPPMRRPSGKCSSLSTHSR